MIDYDVPIPIPTFPPNMNGVVKSLGGATPFDQSGVQQWNRFANGVDWSPLSATVVIGNFDGLNGEDVLLQGAQLRPSELSTHGQYIGCTVRVGHGAGDERHVGG